MEGPQLPPSSGDSIITVAIKILKTGCPDKKALYTDIAVSLWNEGSLGMPTGKEEPAPPRPARVQSNIVPSNQIKSRGKGGSLSSRIAIVHSLCHIENWAIDLAWDIIARFGNEYAFLPPEFYADFITVAEDECRHFKLLKQRLMEMGAHYGDLPVHDGLWESAMSTSESLAGRLAVEHAVHEARGLDILPQTIQRFRKNGDNETGDILENIIYKEEIGHCAAGVRWLNYLFDQAKNHDACWAKTAQAHTSAEEWFHALVRRYFRGPLKPPFNEEARSKAGFPPSWYLPLAPVS